ncbi:hypothetical protein JCM15519_29450 [Fundidesulfovibrio butyratiphilus]
MNTIDALNGYAGAAVTAAYGANDRRKTGETAADSGAASGTKDTVTVSDTARELSKMLAEARGRKQASEAESGSGSSGLGASSQSAEELEKQIEELEKKIVQVEQSKLSDETKKPVVQGLQQQIATLRQQLVELQVQAAKG